MFIIYVFLPIERAELCYQFLLPTLKKRVTNEGFEYCVLSLTLSSPISPVVLVEQLHTVW